VYLVGTQKVGYITGGTILYLSRGCVTSAVTVPDNTKVLAMVKVSQLPHPTLKVYGFAETKIRSPSVPAMVALILNLYSSTFPVLDGLILNKVPPEIVGFVTNELCKLFVVSFMTSYFVIGHVGLLEVKTGISKYVVDKLFWTA
jgi:hypothetical protein